MYIKMQLIQIPKTCAMPFLFQVKQHLERKTGRWREAEREEDYFLRTSNLAPTSEARSQTFPVEIFSFALGFKCVHAINRTDCPCCDFSIA